MESLSGDGPLTAHNTLPSAKDSTGHVIQLENQLKSLMQVTGATSPPDVLNRFIVQKEATTRLNYLRTVTEKEKWQLEKQRDEFTSNLETLCFTVTKESDVYGSTSFNPSNLSNYPTYFLIFVIFCVHFRNQEYLEQLKKNISEMRTKQFQFLQDSDRSKNVLNSIKSTIIDLIQKLNDMEPEPAIDNIIMRAPNLMLLQVLRVFDALFHYSGQFDKKFLNFCIARYLELSCKWA